jgi:endogenous inhibitor of DNA gyrase (YacG/DUF329 family)
MASTPRCPTCGKPTQWEGNADRPFCSARCRIVDLGSWADERYRIAGERVSEDADGPGENGSAGKNGSS